MNNNSKVLHLIADMGNGGAERQLIELLSYNKHHILCTLRSTRNFKRYLKNKNIRYYELNLKRPIFFFTKIYSILNIIKKEKAETIQCWMYDACLISIFISKLTSVKAAIIWSIRCSNMMPSYYSLKLKLVLVICKKFSHIPNQIIYNSKSGYNYHKNIGYQYKNSRVIINGVDKKKFCYSSQSRKYLREKFNIKSDDFVFICVARVDPMKGHEILLNGFQKAKKKNKKLKLILLGKDTNLLKLPNGVIALDTKLDINKYYSMADAIILTSIFGEGFSNALVEGMLNKLVPLATDVGDSKEIIKDIGFLLEVNNLKSITENMLKLAKLEKNIIKTMGRKAMVKAKENYNSEKMIRSYNAIYNDIKKCVV